MEQRAAEFIADYDIPAAVHTVSGALMAADYDIYFVSISPQEVLVPFAERVCDGRAASVSGTVLSVTSDNEYDGTFARNLRADTKAAILPEVLAQSARAGSIAAGDSALDPPLFEAADTGIVTAPENDLPDEFRARADCWDAQVTDVEGPAADLSHRIVVP